MATTDERFNNRQLAFQELFIGTLIYVAVLGLFNDYTSVVDAKSFSTVLLASAVLEILTYFTFLLKKQLVNWLKHHQGMVYRIMTFFCVWLIMFLSKFVFIGLINIIFGEYITIHGFFGILFVVLSVTIVHRLAYSVFIALGKS